MKLNNSIIINHKQNLRGSLKFLILCVVCIASLNISTLIFGPPQLFAEEEPVFTEEPEELEKKSRIKSILENPEEEEDVLSELPIVKIEIEGNVTIPAGSITSKLRTPVGRRISKNDLQRLIRDDIRTLHRTRWFFRIESKLRNVDGGMVLIFQVLERPVVQSVEYEGYNKIKLKRLKAETGLKVGSPFDTHLNRDAAKHLQRFYRDKGFTKATVKLGTGSKATDRKIVFVIYEGPKQKVVGIKFENNKVASDALLRTKLRTKKAILWYFGGKYDPSSIDDDYKVLQNYYQSLGYFDLKIKHKVGFSKKENRVYVTFTLDEGKRYKVRNRKIEGNRVISKSELEKDFELDKGDFFNERHMNKDLKKMKDMYGRLGRLNATVDAKPVFLAGQTNQIDLIYQINEDRVFKIRKVTPHLLGESPHTKKTVIIDRMHIHPGDLADPRQILRSKSRVGGSQLFERAGPKGVRIDIKPVEDEFTKQKTLRGQNAEIDEMIDYLKKTSTRSNQNFNRFNNTHTQPKHEKKTTRRISKSYSNLTVSSNRKVHNLNSKIDALNGEKTAKPRIKRRQHTSLNRAEIKTKITENSRTKQFDSKVVTASSEEESFSMFGKPQLPFLANTTQNSFGIERVKDRVVRAQNFNGPFREPGNPIYDNSPLGDPYGGSVRTPPGEVDLDVYATEAQTGRLMFGVGVNSDAGVVGSIVLSEQNFDISRWPRSWGDSNAFRGGGQSLRVEAVPGNEVSRYMISWTDPYFLGTNNSLGVSGFHFSRFYDDWDELRTGGRVSVGRQFTHEISGSVAIRMENVDIDDPSTPTPQSLTDVLGSSFLSTIRPSISHDTRDSAFLPSEGHFIELAYEQAFGDYSYPKVELEGKQHFTIFSRPDGGGKHTLTVSGKTGWTGSDTPIFEKYYAGGFQTFRGFSFRGVTPRETGVKVGGEFLALGSVEYMLPLMANETIHGVAFTDFGTVEADVGLDDFRIAAGVGLRITVPAMGPAPLAFDFAWPITKNEEDETRLFSFYIGFQR